MDLENQFAFPESGSVIIRRPIGNIFFLYGVVNGIVVNIVRRHIIESMKPCAFVIRHYGGIFDHCAVFKKIYGNLFRL